MFLVDTNVLVYAAHDSATEHPACRGLVERWRSQAQPWYITWPILYEFLRVVSHHQVLRRPWSSDRALEFARALLASSSLEVLVHTDRHANLLAETLREVEGIRGSFFHDTHTAVLMREHGIRRIVTRDTGFHRFPFLEVVDPLTFDGRS